MAARNAWVLNLDADLELAHGEGYTPSAGVLRATAAFAEKLRGALVHHDDVVIDASTREGAARGLVGRAFCPTPRAIAMLVRAGAIPEEHPPFEVLRRVASRGFSASLGVTMPNAAFVTRLDEAREMLRGDPSPGSGWRIKRAYGMAGRGHRVVDPSPRDEDVAFLAGFVKEGGAQIEPNVRIEREFSLHGVVSIDGDVKLGALTEQRTDASGAWIATERAQRAPAEFFDAIAREAERAGRALANAAYFGAFNVDAFTYYDDDDDNDDDARIVLRARSEVNARYSMGFGVGFGKL